MPVRFKAELSAVLVLQMALSGCGAAKELNLPQAKQEQNQKTEKVDLKQLIAEADLYYKEANYLAAEPLYKEVLLRPMAYNSILDITDLVAIANKLAKIYEMREQYDAAEFCHRFALEALKKSPKASKRDKAIAMYKLGCSRQQHGDYNGVELLFRESYQILKQEVVKNPSDAEALNIMAYLTFLSTDSSGAHDMWRRALKAALTRSGKEKLQAAEALNWLTGTSPRAITASEIQQTENLHKQAVQIVESVLGKNDPEVANQLDGLGRFYEDECKDFEKGWQCYASSLKIREKALYEFAPEIGRSLNGLASCKYWQDKIDEAIALERRSNAIKTKFLIPGDRWFSTSDSSLAFYLEQSGKHNEARFLRDRASLVPTHAYAWGPKYKLE
jgi:hypothetical protein